MTQTVIGQLDANELQSFAREQKRRDELAQHLGILRYETHRKEALLLKAIQQSERDEAQMGEAALRKRNLDPDRERYSLDYRTGRILKAGGPP